MAKKICVIHANCQGDSLRQFLELSPEFIACYDIRRIVNYESGGAGIPDLHDCDLFLYQFLGPHWGVGSTDSILAGLPANTVSICIPNMFFMGYWPFWTGSAPGCNEFADSLLENFLQKGLPHEDVFNLYMKCPPAMAGDLVAVVQDSLVRERNREKHTPIKYVDIIEENWRQKQLFLTINHPHDVLLEHVAQSILRILGFPPLSRAQIKKFRHPHGDFWLPIHPVAGKRLGIPFATPERKYNCFGTFLTHGQYTSCYLACRKYGIANFTGVLRDMDRSPLFLHADR